MTQPSPLAPFRNRLFLGYWLTGLSANLGWLIQMVGASWLMTEIGGSPQMVSLVQTSIAVPVMMFSLASGAMADNFGRSRMVIWSQSFLLTVSTALALIAWFGLVTPWLLLAFTFMIGLGKALNNPPWHTLLGEFVPRETLPQAIALGSVSFNLARTVGPAIGGAIVATLGAFAAFAVNAFGNVGMIVLMSRWRGPKPKRDLPPESILRAMGAGLRYVTMSPVILLVLLRTTVFNIAALSLMALLPLIARDLIGGGAQTYGVLLGGFGAGAVAGALLGGPLRQRLTLEWRTRLGFVCFAIAVTVVALSPTLWLSIPGTVLAGASWLMTLSTFNTTVQMSAPRWVVSRCLAVYQTASFGGNALGSLIWGVLAGAYGITTSMLVSALVLLVGAALGLAFPLRELQTERLTPHGRWQAPETTLDLKPQSGPILTTVEYRIRDEDVPKFLALMEERERSRVRDGARHWSLSRQLEDPGMWIERYMTPTWVDTERHHQRRTTADADNGDQVRALNQGGERPKVRHYLDRQTHRARHEGRLDLTGEPH